MLDLSLRPLKERLLLPLASLVPASIPPDTITFAGFLLGLLIPAFSILSHPYMALLAWGLNRLLDGLDGTVARGRGLQTAWGGFIDIVCDFTVYSLIPIGVALSPLSPSAEKTIIPLSLLLTSFHINNVILFYLSSALPPTKHNELTSLRMVPAIIEGAESLVFLTLMIAYPSWFTWIAWTMSIAVAVNIVQRSWLAYAAFVHEGKRRG